MIIPNIAIRQPEFNRSNARESSPSERNMNLRDMPLIRYFAGGRARGRLMREYFLISVLLVGGGLITSGAIEIYYSFQESQEHLARRAARGRHRRGDQNRAFRARDSQHAQRRDAQPRDRAQGTDRRVPL
jgi:hypothetical protein